MKRVTASLVLYMLTHLIQTLPIENGFTVKLNHLLTKEVPKVGNIFARIPQEASKPEEKIRQQALDNIFYLPTSKLSGYSNQVAKITLPTATLSGHNITVEEEELYEVKNNKYLYKVEDKDDLDKVSNNNISFFHLPVVHQPYKNYKVVVATAPPNWGIGSKDAFTNTIVYVVFPENESNDTGLESMPRIFFVNEKVVKTRSVVDPILIVNSSRAVTPVRSREVIKFVRFRHRFI